MTSCVARLLLAAACLLGLAGPSAWAQPPRAIVLSADTPSFTLADEVQSWLEPGSASSIEQVSARPDSFQTVPALHREALTSTDTLWLRLRLVRSIDAPAQWTLNLPLPFVDDVQLFQRDAQGRWQRQQAGDTLLQSAWSLRGPYPDFILDLPGTQEHEVYLRVRNFKHLSIPIRVASWDTRAFQRLTEFVSLGLLLGVLAVLVVLSLIRYAEHRSPSDLAASAFSFLVLMTVAQINGILNMLVWLPWPRVGDYANSVLPVLAVGASLLFVRMLYAISTHFSRYDRFLRGVGIVTIASTLTYAIDRVAADKIGAMVLLVATTTGLIATFLSWRSNSRIWYWLMAAYVPQYLCLLRLMCEALGWLPNWWEMRYFLSLSVALSVPVLVYALSRATHDRKELQSRARHLPTQDALTGLLTREAFATELEKAHERVASGGERIALVVVKVVNYQHIRKGLGDPLAENCLLRAVVKLHRILRDMDPAGRLAADEFGLILDGVMTRQALTERLVQLIGSGLIPLPGLHPPVTLQFHAACLLMHEYLLEPTQALQELETMLEGMSSHTRRPIRHLEPPQTMPASLADSSTTP
ncbi:7TM-DISM domain-containing protein [Curvibacter sp. APW13]|uniref:sensor domain-containing diguanylate cyclase n=1 Tax=Curvibacter sp. APW13 TaxID=3077236 RepID=UPI0028DF592B|nr:7TM-DISM domain-containing protein [Curvibacter sp. APW13]MDT8989718.1 7TM-DISM domain-containing protein [Curvibacter sp. APW13]